MFSQRKSFWKKRWFLLTVIAIIGAGYWFSQKEWTPSDIATDEDIQRTQTVDKKAISEKNSPNNQGETGLKNTSGQNEQKKDNFFLVKKVNDKIEIFYYQDEGEPLFVKSTDIDFSLLSEGDQLMFSEGLIVETEEELNELLQDFGS